MKIAWAVNREVLRDSSAYGYTSASVHLAAALGARSDVELDDDADTVVWFCHARNFHPERLPGRHHVWFTMYELDPPPPEFGVASRRADAIVVPSAYCAKLFRPFFDPSKPIVVSPLGFDPGVWREPARPRFPLRGEPFTFLYVGDRNDRKGWHILMEAWAEAFDNVGHARLVMKLSTTGTDRVRIARHNTVVDGRDLPIADLRSLYDKAHAFVFPSLGEGWGLTALEAAACGLPIVATDSGGVMEFLDPRQTWMVPARRHPLRTDVTWGVSYGKRCSATDLALRMRDVVQNYGCALKMARRQAAAVRGRFTWAHAADALVGHLGALGFGRDRTQRAA